MDFIDEQEPQLIAYDCYFDTQHRNMTVVSVHPGSDSLRLHMEVGRSAFAGFAELLDLQTIEVYGPPNDEVLSLLGGQTDMLGESGHAEVHERHAGFLRMGREQLEG